MATETLQAAGAAAHGEAPATGMPQLDITTFPNQIFWLLVTLVVIYLILTRVALPRIGAVLAERRGTITNDLAAAEELKQKALKAEKAYNDALADAMQDAQQKADAIAAAGQVTLGAIASVLEASGEDQLVGVAFESSSIEVRAQVTVTYLIADTAAK